MNCVNLTGRLTKDIELRYNNDGKAVARFTLAVNRRFTNADGERVADFISCVVWETRAENLSKYTKKGSHLGISGRLQTGSYDKEDGTKVYTTDVVVESFDFLDSKKDERPLPEYTGPDNNSSDEEETEEVSEDPFRDFGDSLELSDDDLPF